MKFDKIPINWSDCRTNISKTVEGIVIFYLRKHFGPSANLLSYTRTANLHGVHNKYKIEFNVQLGSDTVGICLNSCHMSELDSLIQCGVGYTDNKSKECTTIEQLRNQVKNFELR